MVAKYRGEGVFPCTKGCGRVAVSRKWYCRECQRKQNNAGATRRRAEWRAWKEGERVKERAARVAGRVLTLGVDVGELRALSNTGVSEYKSPF